ncbi:hypothetical protein BKD03_11630 [Brucella sp. 09RB8471]|nr:hypothetical protein BKD03_11630 [Brucella sp. 09RB8471]
MIYLPVYGWSGSCFYQNCRNRSNYLFCRIIQRKTASHFCWKCSKIRCCDQFPGTSGGVPVSAFHHRYPSWNAARRQ